MIFEKFKKAIADDDLRGFVERLTEEEDKELISKINCSKIYNFVKAEGHFLKFIEFLKIYRERFPYNHFLLHSAEFISAQDAREINAALREIPDIFYYAKKAQKSSKSPASSFNLSNAVNNQDAWQSSLSPSQEKSKKKIVFTYYFLQGLSKLNKIARLLI